MRVLSLVCLGALTVAGVSQSGPRGVAAENIDRSANACSDFDAYANGGWRTTHPMPSIQTVWAVRTVTQDETRAKLRTIAEEDAGRAASLAKSSPGQLTGDFYGACMDEGKINGLGLKPVEPELKRIEAVKDAKALSAEMVRLEDLGMSAPVNLYSTQDLHAPTQVIAEVSLGGLGLPDRDYYLRSEPRFKDARDKYMVYMQTMFTMSGSKDADAAVMVAAVMKIETALAQARLSRVAMRDPKVQDNPVSFAELKALAPGFDWDAEFEMLGVTKTGHINVTQPAQLKAFGTILQGTPVGEWKTYLRWQLLNSKASYLAGPFETLRFGILWNDADGCEGAEATLAAVCDLYRCDAGRGAGA